MSDVSFTNAWSADEKHVTDKINSVADALRNGLSLKDAYEAVYTELQDAPLEHTLNFFSVLVLSVAMDSFGDFVPDTIDS